MLLFHILITYIISELIYMRTSVLWEKETTKLSVRERETDGGKVSELFNTPSIIKESLLCKTEAAL